MVGISSFSFAPVPSGIERRETTNDGVVAGLSFVWVDDTCV